MSANIDTQKYRNNSFHSTVSIFYSSVLIFFNNKNLSNIHAVGSFYFNFAREEHKHVRLGKTGTTGSPTDVCIPKCIDFPSCDWLIKVPLSSS